MTPGEEANVLHPDETIQILGSTLRVVHVETEAMEVRVREFTFGQEMEIEPDAQPIIEAMGEVLDENPDALNWNQLIAAAARQPQAFKKLLSVSTGLTPEQLDGLKSRDGRMVVVTFFRVNWDFFLDRLVVRNRTKVTRADLEARMASETSSPD